MTDIATLGIKVLSDDIVKATKRLDKLETQSGKTEKKNKKLGQSFGALKAAIAAVGVGVLTRQLIGAINTYTALSNKLKLVTTDAKNLADVQGILFDVAQDTRGSLEGTIDLYSKLARSTKSLGLSQGDLADVTETINQAIAVSGATANEANAAIFQLGQGLSAGALRGEELNSVMEQTPRLAQAMADGLGIGIAQLRKMGSEGKLNSEVVIKALQNQSSVIKSEFEQTSKTVAQAYLQIENVALKTFGSLDSTELIGSLDEFRKVISDPAVIKGLQDIAGGLITLTTWTVKAAAGFASLGDKLGYMFAKLSGGLSDDPVYQLKELNGEIRVLELAQKNVPIGSDAWNGYTDRLTEAYQAATKLKGVVKIIAPKTKETPDKPSSDGSGSVITDDGFSDKQQTALDKLQEGYLSEESLLTAKYDTEQELLDAALENKKISEDQYLDLKFAGEMALFDRQQELAEAEQKLDEDKVAAKTDYYSRLYKLEAGSLEASYKFANSLRKKDLKGVIDNGSLMLANEAKTNKEAFEVQKAFALAKAIVTLPSAVMQSFDNGGGYPWGLIPAGLMLATGLKNISDISSTSFGSKTSSASAGSGGGTSISSPVASGLPAGSTAVPDGGEQANRRQTVTITLNGAGYSKDSVRELITSINEEVKDGAELLVV